MCGNWHFVRFVAIGVALVLLSATRCSAEDADGFYAGKQISLVVGTGPGGGNDLYARVLAGFMARHIPGTPAVVVQNMPGSEGVTAASYIYNVAAKDGTIIATCPASMLLSEALNPPQTRFQSSKFSWVGTIATTTDVLAVFKSTGVTTLQDAKQHPLVIGATGQYSLSALEPAITNALLGTKFHIVKGYNGGGDAFTLAMERHEIEGRTNQWASWKVLRPEWIRDDLLSYLLQYGPKDPGLPDSVPTIDELVKTPDARAIVTLLELPQYMGRSIFAPPGIPPDRLNVLREAFDATMHDSAFVKRMQDLNLELYPQNADVIENILKRSASDRDKTVENMKRLLNIE